MLEKTFKKQVAQAMILGGIHKVGKEIGMSHLRAYCTDGLKNIHLTEEIFQAFQLGIVQYEILKSG